ncbi:MAG: hypothetical protein QOE69_3219 [Thermoleophilaceae bacterium]|nr:hypothetical protein [Thermoleophilaceae bacterium]
MFPRLREQIGTALDLFVEFSTLGEYRLEVEGNGASSAPAEAPGRAPQLGGVGARAPRAAVRRTVAGGPAGTTPVATPAARRLMDAAAPPAHAPAAHPTAAHASAAHLSAAHASAAHPCGTRRHASEAGSRAPARSRARKGATNAPEQLCLAV